MSVSIEDVETMAKAIIKQLGYGRREKVYQNALCYELNYNGITASVEVPHPVYYKQHCVGTTFIDIVTATWLIEIKYVKTLTQTHREQVMAYSRDVALNAILINFGANPIQIEEFKLSDKLSNTNN